MELITWYSLLPEKEPHSFRFLKSFYQFIMDIDPLRPCI